MNISDYVNDQFVTNKYAVRYATLETLTTDQLDQLDKALAKRADALTKEGLRTGDGATLKLAQKYSNAAEAARQVMANKLYA